MFRNDVTKVKTNPGAYCGGNCDHVPVVAEVWQSRGQLDRWERQIEPSAVELSPFDLNC